ncbi:MAG TPA: hypothetical protein VFZ66_24010 [Herpetosiphonaceae bacterium]
MDHQTTKSFTLRLPPDLYEPIAAMAARERRSLHGQVLYLLDRALEAIEDAEDIRDSTARLAEEEAIPLSQAIQEIEHQRTARKAS